MKKILIIEDEPLMAQMYEDSFKQAGFDVTVVNNAKQGFAGAKQIKPDLILLDILLPTENGITLLGKIRKEPSIAKTTVVAFSNYDDPKAQQEALDLKAKAYLLKTNYTPEALVKEIRKHI